MKAKLNELIDKFREFWKALSKKAKIIICCVAAGVVIFAIFGTVMLRAPKEERYKALFPGMESSESAKVYATLQEMEVQAEINEKGQILVPTEMWDSLVFELNGKGYPKTAMSYDTFSSAAGFTATEFEKRTALLFQSQDRMQQTLMRQEGITDAAVTFNIPETSNYIWDTNNAQESSANVTVTMKEGSELTPERVSAIKHLAATSVPKLKPENVVVVDAKTGLEMPSAEDTNGSGFYGVQQLTFEREIAKAIEDNVKRLLTPIYGAGGVTCVATVALDYDKMMTETKQYQPMENGDGGGVRNQFEERYSREGEVPFEGIVGEENNTDIPAVDNLEDTEDGGITDYERRINYDVSYVMTQIEKGAPLLKKATVAAVVNDVNFDVQREETLVDLISKGANIPAENIKVTNLDFAVQETIAPPEEEELAPELSLRQILLLSLIGLVLLIAIVVTVLLLLRRRRRRKAELQELMLQEEAEKLQRDLEKEIADHKRMLQDEAKANTKESAITEEVREFAKDNPEITANLLRSMLREES